MGIAALNSDQWALQGSSAQCFVIKK